jgi:hypothetical protein
MNVGSTSVNQLTCFAGRSLKWMLGHTAPIGKCRLTSPDRQVQIGKRRIETPVQDFDTLALFTKTLHRAHQNGRRHRANHILER